MAAKPDVRVRLSAEGMDDVIKAFKRIESEAKKTKRGTDALSEGLGQLNGLVGGLSVAAAGVGFVRLVKGALETADAVGKLSQKTGVSAESLSVLRYAGELADVTFEQLSKGMIKFNKTMGELDQGSSDAAAGVRRLFGSSKALDGLNTEERFLKVANAVGKLQEGYNKTKTAQDFFGKSGADLIPLFDDLADDGFEKAKLKAQALGLVIDKDLASSAQRANDAIKTLELQAQGAATQFASGLAPAIADAADALTDAFKGEGALDGLKATGEAIGGIAKGITAAFIAVGKTIGFVLAEAENNIGRFTDSFANFRDLIKDVGSKGVRSALAEFSKAEAESSKRRQAQAKEIFNQYSTNLEESMRKLFSGDATVKGISDKRDPGGSGSGLVPSAESAKAALELQKAQLENQLNLLKAYGSLEQQRLEQQYRQRLVDLETYYEKRRGITKTEADKEIAVLEAQRDAIKKASLGVTAKDSSDQIAAKELQRQKEIEAVENKIAVLRVGNLQKLEALQEEQRQRVEDIAKRRIELEQQIQEAQGETLRAALLGIAREEAERRKAGEDEASTGRLANLKRAQAQAAEVQRNVSGGQSELSLVQGQLQNQVASGELFPFEAANRYRDAVREIVPALIAQLEAQRALATTAADQKVQLDQQIVSLQQTKIAAENAASGYASFKVAAEGALNNSLTTFFTRGIDEAENFGDAMRGLASSVVDSLRQVAAQMLSTIITQQLLSSIIPSGGLTPDPGKAAQAGAAQAAPLVAAGAVMNQAGVSVSAGGASVLSAAIVLQAAADTLLIANSIGATSGGTGFAEGGQVFGPGTGTSDSIPARLSAGEFVVNAASTAQPGVLPLLRWINRGMSTPAVARGSIGRFRDGGMVSVASALASSGQQGGPASIHLGIEEGIFVKRVLGALESKDGQRVQVENMRQNQKASKQALGR